MPGTRGGLGLRRRAIADYDIAGLQFGAAERLAELWHSGPELLRRRPAFPPQPRRGLVARQRYQRVNRPGRLDVEREAGAPDPLGGLDLLVAAVARNLELRHRRALR